MIYDVIIIGAGAAGIFAAMELATNSDLNVLLLEKAKRLNDARNTGLGWFGGSARSNVHMFLEPDFGGTIATQQHINMFLRRLQKYGGPIKPVRSKISKKTMAYMNMFGMVIDEPLTISYSEDKMIKLGNNLYSFLKDNITLFHKIDIASIKKQGDVFVIDAGDEIFMGKKCILSMGRAGTQWLLNQPESVKPLSTQSSFDFGVRLEFQTTAIKPLITGSPYFRLRFDSFRTSVPTFSGTIETEEVNHVKIANARNLKGAIGHTGTMSLLKTFQSKNSLADAYRLCEITNLLSESQLMKEPVSKWLNSTSVLSSLPEFDILRAGIVRLLEIIPELQNRLSVYGPEARLNALEFNVNKFMETSVNDLYIVGDMSGKTHSFVQAACSGIVAAQHIMK